MRVTPFVQIDDNYAKTKLSNMAARAIYLLDKQSDQLNLASSKNLRCRLISKMSSIESQDLLDKLYSNLITFRVVCDDEIID